jgi:PRC-barrel domain
MQCSSGFFAEAAIYSTAELYKDATMTDYSTTRSGSVAQSETGSLIAASKVEGTSVYNRQGESLGSVYDLMIDKRSGKVAYSCPSAASSAWVRAITRFPRMYSIMTSGAPSYRVNDSPDWSARKYGRHIGIPPRRLSKSSVLRPGYSILGLKQP